MEINMASLKTQILIANDQVAESQEEFDAFKHDSDTKYNELSQMVCFLKKKETKFTINLVEQFETPQKKSDHDSMASVYRKID